MSTTFSGLPRGTTEEAWASSAQRCMDCPEKQTSPMQLNKVDPTLGMRWNPKQKVPATDRSQLLDKRLNRERYLSYKRGLSGVVIKEEKEEWIRRLSKQWTVSGAVAVSDLPIRNIPYLFYFIGLFQYNKHPLATKQLLNKDLEQLANASRRPIENLKEKSVFLRVVRLDKNPSVPREELSHH